MQYGKEIVIALIGAVASVAVAYIGAKRVADDTVTSRVAELAVASGGVITSSASVTARMGQAFTVNRQGAVGVYRINFGSPFATPPIVVAIAQSDGGNKGASARLVSVDTTGFTVEGRDYAQHGLADMSFHFIVARPK